MFDNPPFINKKGKKAKSIPYAIKRIASEKRFSYSSSNPKSAGNPLRDAEKAKHKKASSFRHLLAES